MLNDRDEGKIEAGRMLFLGTGIMVFLVAAFCFVFFQAGIKIGEGQAGDVENAVEEQRKDLERLEELIQDVDSNVSEVKTSVKSLKNSIKASGQNVEKTAVGEDKNSQKNETGTEDGTAGTAPSGTE